MMTVTSLLKIVHFIDDDDELLVEMLLDFNMNCVIVL